jgi:hypothetical protein
MKYLEPRYVLYVVAYLLGALTIQGIDVAENLMTPGKTYACLPEDSCVLHIVPFGKPWLALTCDLNANKCEDSKP